MADHIRVMLEIGPKGKKFVVRFDEETAMVGYPKARLWVASYLQLPIKAV